MGFQRFLARFVEDKASFFEFWARYIEDFGEVF